MNTSVCTLFEGNYHLGLGALVNSLCQNRFEGQVYAGYRGKLPPWAKVTRIDGQKVFPVRFEMEVTEKVRLVFVPLETDYHFTNYKPDFILDIFHQPDFDADALFYIDPDIVINIEWDTFERWASFGVALCEDVNSPMPKTHPIRSGWRSYFGERGIVLSAKDSVYVNGGFVGVKRSELDFIRLWKKLQESMAPSIGGLSRSSLEGKPLEKVSSGIFSPFSKTDQDALNATIEATNIQVSIAGKESMGFASGRVILPHALGQPKPWLKNPLLNSLSGYPPRSIDKLYWRHVRSPIPVQSALKTEVKILSNAIAALISRFYKRV
jgi:hypothetical protein